MSREQQRAELHRTIWKIAQTVKRQNELRRAIDEIINDLEGNNNE